MTDWTLFFNLFLTHKEIFFAFCDAMPQKIFNNPLQTNLLILVKKFSVEYKKMPSLDSLELLLENLPDGEKGNKKAYIDVINKIRTVDSKVDLDLFEDQLTRAIQTYDIEQFILRSANKIGNITPDEMMSDMRGLITKFAPKSMGIDVTDVGRAIKLIRQDHSEKFSTGIEELNTALYGGYGTDEIAILMAPPGKGKSYFLLNAMYYAMLSGKNILYVTLELSERAVLRRLYSRVAYANKRELMDETIIYDSATNFFKLSRSMGRIIYYPGMSLTVSALESLVEQQEMYFGFKPNMLIVDYLDRLAPRPTDYKGEVRHQLRNITDDLRSIALRHAIPVLSATQANRASLSKVTISEANVSESFGKVEVADVILAMCQNDDEKLAKKARLIVVKNRDNVSGGKIEFYCDFERMFLSDVASATRLGIVENITMEREIK